jgi:hypothetical protein
MNTQQTLICRAQPGVVGLPARHRASRWALLLLLALLSVCCGPLLAGPAPLAKPFAVVLRLSGELSAQGPDGRRLLQVGDTVLVGEHLKASSASEAVLQTGDAGYIAMRPGAELVALQFAAAGKPTDTNRLQLFKGALRLITGWIGKLNRRGNTLTTATVGILGTDHEPYVLLGDEDDAARYKPGTYDKVNQGGTTLQAAGQAVDIAPGKVGFARAAGKSRALMTLLFPVLLEKVPDFYVPGQFDAEMDAWAQDAAAHNEEQLQSRRAQALACVPAEIARRWTQALDQAIVRSDGAAILDLFARDVRIQASVRGAGGRMTELELEGAELADSIVAAVASLRDYQHRRITLDGTPASTGAAVAAPCGPIAVRSIVIEAGRQADKPYRFESEETYQLEQIDGKWRATQAQTRQR